MDVLKLKWTHSNQFSSTHSTAEVTGVSNVKGYAI